MHGRRIACLLLGAWLGVGLFLAFAATQNFRTVDAILQAESSPVAPAMARLGTDQARVLLRYVAGEQNGGYFYAWELFEIGISILLAAVLFWNRDTRKLAIAPGFILVLVLFAHIELTPEMKWLARNLALSPGNSDIHERFVSLHRMYGIVTLVELVLVVALSVLLLTWRTRRGSRRRTKDAADLQMLTQEPH